jgi:hypothetical protein
MWTVDAFDIVVGAGARFWTGLATYIHRVKHSILEQNTCKFLNEFLMEENQP